MAWSCDKCHKKLLPNKHLKSVLCFRYKGMVCASLCFSLPLGSSALLTSPHSSVGKILDLKTRGCEFHSLASKPKYYELSFGLDFKLQYIPNTLKNQAELSVGSSCVFVLSSRSNKPSSGGGGGRSVRWATGSDDE